MLKARRARDCELTVRWPGWEVPDSGSQALVLCSWFSTTFAVSLREVPQEEASRKTLRSYHFFLAIVKYFMDILWVGQLGGHGSQHCVPCPAQEISSPPLLLLLRERREQQ